MGHQRLPVFVCLITAGKELGFYIHINYLDVSFQKFYSAGPGKSGLSYYLLLVTQIMMGALWAA